MPKTKVIRFAIYAFIATFVIKARSQVEDLSIANDGTKSALTEQYFEFEPRPRKFNDIKDVKDVQSWLRWLCNSLQAAGNTDEYSNPLSLNLHNRVTPTSGICLNASSITLSFRRVKLSSDAAASTTTRFSAFYPQTWKAFTIDPGTDLAGSDIEATSPIVASTPSTLSWLYTPACKSCSNTGSSVAYGSSYVCRHDLVRFLNRQKSFDQLRRFTRLHDLDIFGSSLDLLNIFIVFDCILKDFLSVNTVLLGICASPHVGKNWV